MFNLLRRNPLQLHAVLFRSLTTPCSQIELQYDSVVKVYLT